MNWRHSFARKREVHKNGENFSDNLGNEPVCRSCDSDSGNLLKSSGETLWGKMAVSGVACGGDTALRADTAEPAGANGDNAGTGAFGAEQHTRGTGAENTGLFVQRDTAEPTEPATPIAPAEQTQEESAEKRDAFDFLLAYPYVLWLGGVLGFLAWQGWKYYDFRRMLKRNRRKIMDASVLDTYYTLCRETGMEKRPAIYFCEALPSPLCVGLFRTAVYLNSEEREPCGNAADSEA